MEIVRGDGELGPVNTPPVSGPTPEGWGVPEGDRGVIGGVSIE